MSKKYFIVLKVTILAFLCSGLAYAQESVNSTGGNASGSGGSVSFTVGQVFYITSSGVNGTSAEGVQHAYDIYSLGYSQTNSKISLLVFPNPTGDNLYLDVKEFKSENLCYQLIDVYGKLILKEQIIEEQSTINMSKLPSATYFLNIVNQKGEKIQLFKVIKS